MPSLLQSMLRFVEEDKNPHLKVWSLLFTNVFLKKFGDAGSTTYGTGIGLAEMWNLFSELLVNGNKMKNLTIQ